MKLLRAILAGLACGLLTSGCFIFDEIEEGRAIMEAHTPDSEKEKPESLEAAGQSPKSARERLSEYYAKQRAKAPEPEESLDPADDVGRCRIGGSTQFTRRSDCRLRGGTFL